MCTGMILLFLSGIRSRSINLSEYTKNIDLNKRPWGLKNSELRKIKKISNNQKLNARITVVLILRYLGFLFLCSVPLIIIIKPAG